MFTPHWLGIAMSTSEYVLGIKWADSYPKEILAGFEVRKVDWKEGISFVKGNFEEIFKREVSSGKDFYDLGSSEAKERYYEKLGDFFLIKDLKQDRDIGYLVGAISEWSTYNLRSV